MQSFQYINLSTQDRSDSQNDNSKELNLQRGVTVQISLQISDTAKPLASVNDVKQTAHCGK